MLVLARKAGDKVCIGGEITFTVVAVQGNRVRLGIDAPSAVRVVRKEFHEPPAPSAPASGAHRQQLTKSGR